MTDNSGTGGDDVGGVDRITGVRRLEEMVQRPLEQTGDEREVALAARTWRSASTLTTALAVALVVTMVFDSGWGARVPVVYLLVPIVVAEALALAFRWSHRIPLWRYSLPGTVLAQTPRRELAGMRAASRRDWITYIVTIVVLMTLVQILTNSS